jgi:uncharacterized membrane protein
LTRRSEEAETERLEAFSDGIFAFAITLLVLGLYDPTTRGFSNMFRGFINEWPSFFALATSFLTILVMWMNHHNMFNYVKRLNRRFMFLNGLLLMFVNSIGGNLRRHFLSSFTCLECPLASCF